MFSFFKISLIFHHEHVYIILVLYVGKLNISITIVLYMSLMLPNLR